MNGIGGEAIYRFREGNTAFPETAPNTWGYTAEKSSDGLLVQYLKFKDGNSIWPYFNISPGEISRTDWSQSKFLILNVRNLSPSITPTMNIIVRDRANKIFSTHCRVRCNSLNRLLIPVDKIAEKIDPTQIGLIQFAFSKPAWGFGLEYISLVLDGKRGKTDPDSIVPAVYDLRRELLKNRKAVIVYDATRMVAENNEVTISFRKYEEDMDKWPGVTIVGGIDGALSDGDMSTKTHLSIELEPVDGIPTGLGLTLIDSKQEKIWTAFSHAPGGKLIADVMIHDMKADLSQIASLSLGRTMPPEGFTFRINKYQFEFRPEAIYSPVLRKLDALLRLKLTDAERNRVESTRSELEKLYNLVKGESARNGDIHDFLEQVVGARELSARILRVSTVRNVREAMKNYDYSVGIADSMTSVFLTGTGFAMEPAVKVSLEMAANEYESFQTVVFSDKPLRDVRVEVSEFEGPGSSRIQAHCAVVGHANAKRMTYPAEHTGFYPDFIIDYQQQANIEANETVPFWIRLKTSADAAPGLYRATVTVTGRDLQPYRFPLEIKVYDFRLPKGSPLPSAYNSADGDIKKIFKLDTPELYEKVMNQFVDYIADYKLTYDRIYYGPYSNYDRSTDTVFSKWKRLNERGVLKSFCILNTTPHPSFTANKNDPDDPGVLRLLEDTRKYLDFWLPVAREYGILDKAFIYGFDEGNIDAVTANVFGFIKANYPELPIMTTADIHSADMPGLENIDIWVPIATRYGRESELIAALRKRNIRVWWYICNFPRPPEPTFMLEVPALVPRLFMGIMSWKYQPEGFLYWSICCWKEKAEVINSSGPRTNWNPNTCQQDNEEGNLFVPGHDYTFLPTIRVENFRDGIEDLWYYTLLRDRIRELEQQGKGDLTQVNQAKALLKISDDIIKSTGDYTIDPEQIRRARRKAAEALETLRKF
jgi:hypothetical protein